MLFRSDRPLVKPADYARFAGHVAKLECREPVAGQRRFTGRILSASDATLRLAMETGEVEIPIPSVSRAKLVLTDELIRAAKAGKVTH